MLHSVRVCTYVLINQVNLGSVRSYLSFEEMLQQIKLEEAAAAQRAAAYADVC